MRVAHVIDNLSPGGTERQCLELVRGLVTRGVECGVYYFRPGSLIEDLGRLGVVARPAPPISLRSSGAPFRLMRLARMIRQWAPQVVQTYGFYSNIPGISAACLARVPIRVAGRRDLARYLGRGQRSADRWAWRLAHRIVVNSEAVRQQLITEDRIEPGKIAVIRNGLALEEWSACDRSPYSDGEAVVGMLAHFREQKDHATFLLAAAKVLKSAPSVRFCLIGSGPLEKATRHFADRLGITAHVDMLVGLEREALKAVVRRWRVSVLSSNANEGLPNAVIESMAAGLPVVATAVGGTCEVVDDGETGFLVPVEDPTALADRILLLLKDPARARAMGERAREKVGLEFTVNRMVDEFLNLYSELLGNLPASRAMR